MAAQKEPIQKEPIHFPEEEPGVWQAEGWPAARVARPGVAPPPPLTTAASGAPHPRLCFSCIVSCNSGMPGIHIDIKHDLGTGGDPTFSGTFHGAGSGGGERRGVRRPAGLACSASPAEAAWPCCCAAVPPSHAALLPCS